MGRAARRKGADVAAWFNGRARKVTPARIEAFRRVLPNATVYAATSLEEARADAKALLEARPRLVFCGGGDGTVVVLLNLLRDAGCTSFPTIALFKLGTGNGWPSAVGAFGYSQTLEVLEGLPRTLPTQRFDLIETEGKLSVFAGIGWDATLVHDYHSNLARARETPLAGPIAGKLNEGLGGYLFSLFTRTVPGEIEQLVFKGRTRMKVEDLGGDALTLVKNQVVRVGTGKVLYEGAVSVGAAATEPYWGAKFKAFPHARRVPGCMNFRVYDRPVFEGVANMVNLWRGNRVAGMHDFFVTSIRVTLSRPMPFQIGGDVIGLREQMDFKVAAEKVDVLDWAAVRRRSHQSSSS
jgi:diacylglycerol kinase family enzyme